MRVHCTNRMNVFFRFVSVFLLPVLINASLSVCECVCTIFIVSSLNKVMASAKRLLTQIDCPNNTHTHTRWMSICVCALITSTDLSMYNGTSKREWESVCVRRRNSWSFISFVFACICDNLLKSSVVFASPLCVYLPWRVICIAISGLHTQQFGFFRNQENK